MPRFHKLSPAEITALEQPTLGARAQVAREYDIYGPALRPATMGAPSWPRASGARWCAADSRQRPAGAASRCASAPARAWR